MNTSQDKYILNQVQHSQQRIMLIQIEMNVLVKKVFEQVKGDEQTQMVIIGAQKSVELSKQYYDVNSLS